MRFDLGHTTVLSQKVHSCSKRGNVSIQTRACEDEYHWIGSWKTGEWFFFNFIRPEYRNSFRTLMSRRKYAVGTAWTFYNVSDVFLFLCHWSQSILITELDSRWTIRWFFILIQCILYNEREELEFWGARFRPCQLLRVRSILFSTFPALLSIRCAPYRGTSSYWRWIRIPRWSPCFVDIQSKTTNGRLPVRGGRGKALYASLHRPSEIIDPVGIALRQ